MSATTQEALEIQVQVSGRRPVFLQQAAGVAAANGAPSLASDGVSVDGKSGRATVDVALVVGSNSSTGVELRLWGYYVDLGLWAIIDGSTRTLVDGRGWTQIMRGGPLSRIYIEITAITGGDVDLYTGPCDVA